ncbi:DUF5615 family PIN-like protein [Algoriphagus namhaensis]
MSKKHSYTLVTFDSDFVDLLLLRSFPPKVIWLQLGNSSTKRISAILLSKKEVD